MITGGITEGLVPELTVRPYAQIDALTEAPGCGGLKRTNAHEYLTATCDISVVAPATFEELDGTFVRTVDNEMRYAVLNMPDPFVFIEFFPRDIVYFQEDKYHRAKLGFEAWFSVPANYRRK